MAMKLLASDFDGTLFFEKDNPQYRPKDIEAIARFQKAGNLFGLCTGRPLKGVTAFVPESLNFDFYILNSGALILDKNDQVLMKKSVPLRVLSEAMAILPDLQTFIVTEDVLYMYNDKQAFASELIRPLLSKEELKQKEILSFSFHLDDEKDAAAVLTALSKFPEISVYQNRCDIDCVARGCSKKTGIDLIQKHFNLTGDQLACIGDSYNDLPMLTHVQNSFTFTYSPENVQKQARHVVLDIAECIDLLEKENELT